jgi:hypothetical protein
VKWAVKFSEESGSYLHVVGVVSDAFTKNAEPNCQNMHGGFKTTRVMSTKIGGDITYRFFRAGDVVTVELERRHGQDGVMRVRAAGKAFVRDMTSLPRDGMLYPASTIAKQKLQHDCSALNQEHSSKRQRPL